MNDATPDADTCRPTSPFVTAMLTDMYQLTMCYAYFRAGKHDDHAVFDLFFRKAPFNGAFAVFAGLDECLRHVSSFAFTDSDLAYLRELQPAFSDDFLLYLGALDMSAVRIYAIDEGSVVFPRVPLIRVEGPLGAAQLLETTLLNLVNFASLIATNAARFRIRAGPTATLLEFGLRRAQGPDGGMSASRYAYMGGFDATSNVAAGRAFGIPVRGTHAHSFVSSFVSLEDLRSSTITTSDGDIVEFAARAVSYRDRIGAATNDGELAAFISYAQAFPRAFLALIDTYNVLVSGVNNFLAVALALHDAGYSAIGLRLDSGDLAYYSVACRKAFEDVGARFGVSFATVRIFASNDINEDVLHSLGLQGHAIDAFGIGTHLVTCQAQPALGCVYKLVEVHGVPRIKLSAELGKVTIPGRKTAYRLYSADGSPVLDLLAGADEPAPLPGQRVRCNHPIEAQKRCDVVPSRVDCLHRLRWDGKTMQAPAALRGIRDAVSAGVRALRDDHLRYVNPTPYKVSLTTAQFEFMHALWLKESPVELIH